MIRHILDCVKCGTRLSFSNNLVCTTCNPVFAKDMKITKESLMALKELTFSVINSGLLNNIEDALKKEAVKRNLKNAD